MDNNPLTYILTTARLDATGHRWVAALSSYNFTLTYRSGKLNQDADALSRLPEPTDLQTMIYPDVLKTIFNTSQVLIEERPLGETLVMTQAIHADFPEQDIPQDQLKAVALTSSQWNKSQGDDPVISRVKEIVVSGQKPSARQLKKENANVRGYIREWDKLIFKSGVLYRKISSERQESLQLIVPSSIKDIVLNALHDDMGHQGCDRTLALIKTRFFCLGMSEDVDQKVRECIRQKSNPRPAAELVNITSSYPMELVCIDYLSLEPSRGDLRIYWLSLTTLLI